MSQIIGKKISVKEFREMEFPDNDFFIYELINGVLMRRTAPKPLHQDISWNLSLIIGTFLKENPDTGKGYTAPIDVFFDNYNQTQPDLAFISNDRLFIIDKENGIMGAPDLIVEIMSPSSIKVDRFDKKEMYKKFAVKEYWIIDPKNETLEIYIFDNNDYRLLQFLESEGKVESSILKGLEMDVKSIFS